MATIDSIELKLSANADKATTALKNLKDSLTQLSAALAPASSGLESMVVSLGKLVGMQSGLSSISKTFSTLANSWTALNASTKQSSAEMAGISDKARTMAQSFAKEYGIKSKGSVTELTNAFHKLYSSVGDTAAMGQALEQIEHLIREFAQLKSESTAAGVAIREALQATTIKLPADVRKELGSDLIKYMGSLSHVSSKTGALPSEIVKEINRSLDPNAYLGGNKDYSAGFINITGIDNEAQILQRLVDALTAAEGKTMTFYEAARQDGGVITHLNEQLNAVATSLGTTMTGATETYLSAVHRIMEISPELANQFMQFDTAIDSIAQNGNPFENVLAGLTQLQGIHLSDSLTNITAIKDAISKFGADSAAKAATNLPGIVSALRQLDGFTVPAIGEQLVTLASGMSRLGSKSIGRVAENLIQMQAALQMFHGFTVDEGTLRSVQALGDALYKFGLAKMEKAMANIPQLATSVRQLITSLSGMPAVSENTIRLVSALSNVNVNANMAGNAMGGRLSNGLRNFTLNARSARKASISLASAFGRMYANFFLFFRIARRIKKDIDLASQLTEIQNVIDVTFGDAADKMNDFAKAATDTLGMSELTAKQIGSKYQAMGTAMGISKSMAQSTNDFVQKATSGYADVANSMADISINLTRLAGDMASFYNQDYADVAEKLQAIFTGQTKPLRAYGIDLTNATLKEWALNHGMEANIKTMTQAEKTLLRYQYVMAQTAAAHGDFERTQKTWANTTRIAAERLNQLRIVLGKILTYSFKPLVQGFNRAMEQIIKGAEGLLNSLGKIFGWQIEWSSGGILNDEAEDAEDLADGMGEAADNAKKFKNFLLGIDELNLLPDNSDDKDKGGADALGGLGKIGDDFGKLNIKPIEKPFESLYDTLFKLGKKINEVIRDLLKGIDWDSAYEKARNFGKGLAKFLNGLLLHSETFYEIGKFFAGGVNLYANALDALHKEFDGFQFGIDIGKALNGFMDNLDWDVIKSAAIGKAHDIAQTINAAFVTIKWKDVGKTIAEGLNTAIEYFFTLGTEIKWSVIGASIASAINGLFANFDFAKAAETLNAWAKGLLDLIITALDKTDWRKVGESIGLFIQKIDFISIATKIVTALWKALDGVFSTFGGMFSVAPFETALSSAVIVAFSSRTLRRDILKGIRKYSLAISGDIANLFKGNLFSTFSTAFRTTEVGLDSFGNLTSGGTLQGLANGFNAVSASLSTATKAVGGLAVGFGELFAVKNLASDLAKAIAGNGDASIAGSIVKLIGVVGLAGTAFSLLLGVPTGIVIAGATAAVGAIAGITKAMEEMRQENAMAAITRDMGEAYGTLNELTETYKSVASNITDGLDKLHNDYVEVDKLKNSLNDMAGGYSLVVAAIDGGNQLTSGAMKELIGNIGDVKAAWEDYIQAQYNYLIESTMNDYQFAKSQGLLTEEKEQEYLNRIQELVGAREEEVKEFRGLIEELEKAQNYYNTVMEQGVTNSTKEFADNWLSDATKAVLEFGSATGAITNGELSEFENTLDDLHNIKFDFSNIDATNYDEALTEIGGHLTQIQEAYANGMDSINRTISERVSSGDYTEEAARKSVQDRIDALNKATKESLDSVQLNLFDILTVEMKDGNRQSYITAHDMNEEFIKPLMEQITVMYEQAANGEKPKLEGIIFNLFKDTWSKGGYFDGGPVFKDAEENIGKYRKQIEDATSVGSKMPVELKPVEDSMTIITDVAKTGASALGEVSDGLKDVSKTGGKSWDNTLHAMVDVNSQIGLLKSGAIDIKDAFEKTTMAGNSIKDVSNNFGALGGVISNLTSAFMPIKAEFGMFATETQANMLNTTRVFGDSFANIAKYGNQTISWLKGSFVPYFSGSYWSSITSSIPNAFGNAFKQAINIMMNLWKQFAQWANQNMKMNVNLRGKEVTGVEVNIPQYDTGGFPKEDGMFMANHNEMVGQFANGKTAVANNEQIVEGIKQGVAEAMAESMQNLVIQNNVELQGDAADFFTAIVKENNRAIMRTGSSPIRV